MLRESATPWGPEVIGGGNSTIPCSEINNRAMEATLVIRQHASALSVGFEPDARPQAMQMLAWLDQWAGRLRGFVELGEYSMCLDDGDTETYRRALVSAQRIANQARDDLLRPVRAPHACALCGSAESYLDEVVTDDRGGRMFVCSDTDHCSRRQATPPREAAE